MKLDLQFLVVNISLNTDKLFSNIDKLNKNFLKETQKEVYKLIIRNQILKFSFLQCMLPIIIKNSVEASPA